MSCVNIRGCRIGEGRPKVILPIVERTEAAILEKAAQFSTLLADCYFLNATGKEMIFVSPEGNPVMATEGYRIEAEDRLDHVNPGDVELLIIPGGDITQIDTPEVWEYLKNVHDSNGRIAAICAGVDVLEHAGLLEDAESIHSCEKDVVTSRRITTSRANGYVDFAIEVAKQMELFEDEADLQETIAFWREFQRVE